MPRRTRRATAPELPPEMWQALYSAADAYATTTPWDELTNLDLLGLDHPTTGEPLLGCVLGNGGEIFGLLLYRGEGVRYILEVAVALEEDDIVEPEEDFSVIWRQDCVKVEFVPKRELSAVEKKRVKELGFTPSDKWSWPTFESVRLGYAPWHIDADEAALLLHALPRMTALAAFHREHAELIADRYVDEFPFWPASHEPGAPLALEEIEWRTLRPPPEPEPAIFQPVEEELAALAVLPRGEALILEVDAFVTPNPISESGERPWFARTALAADAKSGMIAGLGMGKSPAEPLELTAGEALLKAVGAIRRLPAVVRVCQPGFVRALEPVATRLGCKVELQSRLQAVEAARAALSQFNRLL